MLHSFTYSAVQPESPRHTTLVGGFHFPLMVEFSYSQTAGTMIFEQYYLECLSQASYLIGDKSSGKSIVIDPRRDISPYLHTAELHGLSIEWILETHFHADFVSGHLELAKKTKANIGLSSEANAEFDFTALDNGHLIQLGDITCEVLHTPGHTPESMCVVVTDKSNGEDPWAIFTGDTMFIGDVGRPDLLVSINRSAKELASELYDSIHNVIMALPDETLVFPGHGAGSSCGKNLSTATSSTIGDQRKSNYAVQATDRETFIKLVLEDQSPPPKYFSHDASLNQKVRPLYDESDILTPITLEDVPREAVVLDTRSPEEYAMGHIKNSINVGLAGRYAEFVGSLISFETPIAIVANPSEENEARMRLARVGLDNVIGYIPDLYNLLALSTTNTLQSSRITCFETKSLLEKYSNLQIVDVRNKSEISDSGSIDNSIPIPLSQLHNSLHKLHTENPIIVYCASGYRSSIASSWLRHKGFSDVSELIGGFPAWKLCEATTKD